MDFYAILGVDRKASKEQIRKAFRDKARKYHPDRNKDEDAPRLFKECKEAYSCLIDEERRAYYDETGNAPENVRDESLVVLAEVVDQIISRWFASPLNSYPDIVKSATKVLIDKETQTTSTIKNMQTALDKLEAAAKSISVESGENYLNRMCSKPIEAIRNNIDKASRFLLVIRKAQEVLKLHKQACSSQARSSSEWEVLQTASFTMHFEPDTGSTQCE